MAERRCDVEECQREVPPHVAHDATVTLTGSDYLGRRWCCECNHVQGYGPTPEAACTAFDKVWREGYPVTGGATHGD